MTRHELPFEQLVAFAAGELPKADADALRGRLSKLPGDRVLVARIERVLASVGELEQPRPEAIERLVRLATVAAPPMTLLDLWRRAERLVAHLVFDSRTPQALAGYRGGGSETTQLAYESEQGRIDLQVGACDDTDTDTRCIRGHVMADAGTTPETVGLVTPDLSAVASSTSADEHGYFELLASPGRYDLVVGFGDDRPVMVAPDVEVA